MAEKESYIELRTIFREFISDNIVFSTPNENPDLKFLFSEASKKKTNNRGRPDYILYNGRTITIFECKTKSLKSSIDEAKYYAENIFKKTSRFDNIKTLKIFTCGFVNKYIYEIFKFHNGKFLKVSNKLEDFLKKVFKKTINIQNNSMLVKKIHDIHNYIRDNTKISNEDKSLFIGGIFLCLKNTNLRKLILSNNETEDISSIVLLELKKYEIDLSYIFQTLNKTHLVYLTTKISEIFNNNLDIDLLNNFYSEFVSYSNSDSRSLGIVLTPHHIVKLMVKLLDINQEDIVLDLCSGTGSFLFESLKYNPRNIIGCEYQKKLFNLLKINSFLRDGNIKYINGDCFEQDFEQFKITKSIINPPYGMKNKNEFEFVLKQLDSIIDGGIVCCIIPSSCITAKKNFKLRKQITSNSKVKCIIKCNKYLFYPVASISTVILLLQKCKEGHNFQKDIIEYKDYSDDGFIIEKHIGKVKTETYDLKYENILKNGRTIKLKDNEEWLLNDNNNLQIIKNITVLELTKRNDNLKCILNELNDESNNKKLFDNDTKYKLYFLKDILILNESSNLLVKKCKNNRDTEYKYPVITSSKERNGIGCFYKEYIKENCYTINKDGSIGFCFYHPYKFSYTSHVICFNLNIKIKNPILFCMLMTKTFSSSVYNFNLSLNRDRLLKESIYLPEDLIEIN